MKKLFLLVILIIASSIIGMLWWQNGISPASPNDKTFHIFVVPKGEEVREIANKLKTKNLIKDPIVFFLMIKKLGLDKKIEAGDFRLSPSMSAEEIAQNLTHGTIDLWVTIPEGQRAEEIADMLEKNVPNYQSSWRNQLVEHEGYLFPDTYLIPKDADINLIINIMKNNFDKKFKSIKNPNSNLSTQQIVIIASMIEREAKFQKDRPLVASVVLNRLKLSMPLQIDATVQYTLGYQKNEKRWWKKNLTLEDLNINSSYNTYKNIGLPPAPIANPGLDALQRVLNPALTDYLYYISDKSGHLHFAKTLEAHNLNIQKYVN
ncbi:MAG: endolytic transglycosylase MltG [Patescibacteria group bacterium]